MAAVGVARRDAVAVPNVIVTVATATLDLAVREVADDLCVRAAEAARRTLEEQVAIARADGGAAALALAERDVADAFTHPGR